MAEVMATINTDKNASSSLLSFVEKLIEDNYKTVEKLCDNAKMQTKKVIELEANSGGSQYSLLCNNVINEAEAYIGKRIEKYIPYVLQLSEKAADSHDCTNCSGGCKLNHDIHLLELKASNDMMRTMLYKLQMASLPLYADTMFPDEYRLLRNQMALLETNLTELFFLENNYLIPKIKEAQIKINAGSH